MEKPINPTQGVKHTEIPQLKKLEKSQRCGFFAGDVLKFLHAMK